jgi:hypothetical protein
MKEFFSKLSPTDRNLGKLLLFWLSIAIFSALVPLVFIIALNVSDDLANLKPGKLTSFLSRALLSFHYVFLLSLFVSALFGYWAGIRLLKK